MHMYTKQHCTYVCDSICVCTYSLQNECVITFAKLEKITLSINLSIELSAVESLFIVRVCVCVCVCVCVLDREVCVVVRAFIKHRSVYPDGDIYILSVCICSSIPQPLWVRQVPPSRCHHPLHHIDYTPSGNTRPHNRDPISRAPQESFELLSAHFPALP